MENKVKKVKLENVKNLTTKKLIEEFIRKGGRIQKIKPMKIGKTWSDIVGRNSMRIGHITGGLAYGK
jgi:hypothetical protein|tara:strand:- start:309 stop:509 length:201 start_codon:yes stop_codon:yes gene_type:complete